MKILIVDDEIEVASLLARAVEAQGHQATVAHDGELALALLTHLSPDGVFLDVRLPEMSGIDVLRRIRALYPELPVVLITGHALPGEIDEARRLNVTDVIEKLHVVKHLSEALGRLKGSTSPFV